MDSATIKGEALRLGFDTVGITPALPIPHFSAYEAWLSRGFHGTMAYMARQSALRADPRSLLPSARSIIAVTLNYNQEPIRAPGKPKIARYALGRDYHKVLRSKLRRLALFIGGETRVCVDSAPIFDREYAQLAGLGWFGKNTMLIDSRRGSWFFIGLLLSSLELDFDAPAIGGCGSCSRCIEACPTGAIVFEGGRWQVDSRRCISYLTIEHAGPIDIDLQGWTFGCDVCQEVCPFNEPRSSQPLRAARTTEPDFLAVRDWPELDKLKVLSTEEWDTLTQGSAVRRTGLDGLRRNAAIVYPGSGKPTA